jgi:dUTPase
MGGGGDGDGEMLLKVKKLHENAIIPTRSTEGAAGYDLFR